MAFDDYVLWQHAAATQVSVIVEDNGRGFDRTTVDDRPDARRSLGIIGMEERAALAGGHLEIETAPNAGATVYVPIPLPAKAREGVPDAG